MFDLRTYSVIALCILHISRVKNSRSTGSSRAFAWFVPIYLAECSPLEQRGTVSLLMAVGTRVWIMLASIVGLPSVLGTETFWSYGLLIPVLPALIHCGKNGL